VNVEKREVEFELTEMESRYSALTMFRAGPLDLVCEDSFLTSRVVSWFFYTIVVGMSFFLSMITYILKFDY
jgi:hypothetical protein